MERPTWKTLHGCLRLALNRFLLKSIVALVSYHITTLLPTSSTTSEFWRRETSGSSCCKMESAVLTDLWVHPGTPCSTVSLVRATSRCLRGTRDPARRPRAAESQSCCSLHATLMRLFVQQPAALALRTSSRTTSKQRFDRSSIVHRCAVRLIFNDELPLL